MDEEKGVEQQIKDSNARFYKAFESLSIEKMGEVWKHIVCLENIDPDMENKNIVRMGVTATNIFEKQNVNNSKYNSEWLMVHHHGS